MLDDGIARLFVVSENSLSKEGLKRILSEGGFAVDVSYSNCCELITELLSRPETMVNAIVLVDKARDSEGQSIIVDQLTQAFPDCHVVLLSSIFDFDAMVDAFQAGADAYLTNEIDCRSLIGSLKLVSLGEKLLPSKAVEYLPTRTGGNPAPISAANEESELFDLLSEREVETLRCLIMGYPNKVIANRLDISDATVKVHVKAILRKLKVQNRTQAAIWAVNNGLGASVPCATSAQSLMIQPNAPLEGEEKLLMKGLSA
jgi:two-component system nitrate/nitrite response regulator NarL